MLNFKDQHILALIDEKSIAVLPFENMSSDPENEYFSDGMTEEIINALSRVDGLKVTARTSSFVFKKQRKDVREIGRELGVSLVLEGSIRKSGDRVRITAQLIRTDNGFHIWSENFDRKLMDIFKLQDEISLLIANKIRENFGHLYIQDRLVNAPTHNIDAYQLYLKGRYFHNKWNLPDFNKAAGYYKRSKEEDPTFDLPYFGLGLSYSFLGSWGGMDKEVAFKLADDFFRQGNLLNIPSIYSYYCVAKHLFWGNWNYKDASSLLLKAYEWNPHLADTNEFIAEINTTLGDFQTALKHIETSLKVNPLSPNHFYTKANIYYLQGQFDEALKLLEKALTLDPDFAVVIELKLACQIHVASRDKLEKSVKEHRNLAVPELYGIMFRLVRKEGVVDLQLINATIDKIRKAETPILFAWDLFLLIYSGQMEEAMRLLKLEISNKKGQVVNFKHDPFMEPLRNQPSFTELALQHFPDDKLKKTSIKKESEKEILTPKQAAHYSTLLLTKMEEGKYYLSADLNLRKLAEKIELHPNKLSWLLNNKIEKNFNDFVNNYRLKEFQLRAVDKKNKHLSILGLAYESGFNSKSVFNEYFKKATGVTPKKWVNQQKTL